MYPAFAEASAGREPIAVIDYTEAVKALKESKKKFEYPVDWGLNEQGKSVGVVL